MEAFARVESTLKSAGAISESSSVVGTLRFLLSGTLYFTVTISPDIDVLGKVKDCTTPVEIKPIVMSHSSQNQL